MSGHLVKVMLDGVTVGAGRNNVVWNGCDDSGRSVAAGIYFYRLTAGEFSETKKMTLIR